MTDAQERRPVHTALLEHLDYLLDLMPLTTEDGSTQLLVACISIPMCLQDLQLINAAEADAMLTRIRDAHWQHTPKGSGMFDDNPPRDVQ